MNRFISAFAGTIVVVFGAMWGITALFSNRFVDPEAGIVNAHSAMVARCDVGQVLMLGDSTVNADYLPELIGPHVRSLALGGAHPMESYYILRKALRCPHKPKAVVFAYTPFKLATDLNDGGLIFWGRAINWHALSWGDAEDARATLRRFGDRKFLGPRSLFDLDARLKIFLYSHSFPPYYFPSFLGYLNAAIRYYEHKPGGQDIGFRHRLWADLYRETLEDYGHHSYGQNAEFEHKDLETGILDYRISPLWDHYLRKAIRELHEQNIDVYFSRSARNAFSVTSYNPKIVPVYEDYLKTLARDEGLRLLQDRFYVLPSLAFGDDSHLNTHGAFWQSMTVRHGMADRGAGALVYTDDALRPHNLYDDWRIDLPDWHQVQPGVTSTLVRAPEVPAPTLAYPMPQAVVVRYAVADGAHPDARLNPPPSDARTPLTPSATYIASVFVRNDTARIVTWRLLLQGGYDGGVSWDFVNRRILYGGQANPLNSGVELCSGGWIRLWARGAAPEVPAGYQDTVLQTGNSGAEAIYAYGPSMERAFNSQNDCTMTPTAAR